MPRTNRSARQAGARFEREVANHLRDNLSEFIDRRVKNGAKDLGDIANVRDSHNNRIAVEVKNVTKQNLPQWIKEAKIEAENDGALCGVVVSKRHGNGNVGEQWVHLTVDDLILLLKGGVQG